jgi:hypothetical protein
MIILDATTKSLQFKLGGTATANQLPFSASYVDSTSTATIPGEQDGTSNNTTAVNVTSAPAASTQRLVKNIIIRNADTAVATVTVIYNNNATLRNIIVVTLAAGDQLIYEDGQGWSCLDSSGNIKTSGSGGGGGGAVSSVSNSDGTLIINPTTGNVVASLNPSAISIITQNAGGFINKFRNGTFDVWQRGTSGTVTMTGAYTADGWVVVPTGANSTWAQTAGRASTLYALKMTGATSVTDILIKQRIESYIAAVLYPNATAQVTVQAKIYNNTGGTITPTITVKHCTAPDNWASATTDAGAVSLQACANSALTQVAYTFASASGTANGLEVTIDFGNNFSTTGKSIEVSEFDIRVTPDVSTGLNATPPTPELRSIMGEMTFNQRYYGVSF